MGLGRGEGADPLPLAVIELPVAEAPRASVLIPATASHALLVACLSSMARHLPAVPFETIVVLNDAMADDVDALADAVRGVNVLWSPVNLGLAGAANRARRAARGELLVLLHDDAEVEAGWLDALVAAADRHPRAGAIGSKVLNFDGSLQFAGAVLHDDASTTPVWGDGPPPPADEYDVVREVDYCGTSSLLVRASMWDCIGGLDERYYPVYYADVDLATAIRAHGGTVLVEPASRIRHHRGASTTATLKAFVAERNRGRYVDKWRAAECPAPVVAPSDAAQERMARTEARALTEDHSRWIEAELATTQAAMAALQRARVARWSLARAVNGKPMRFCIGGEVHDHEIVHEHEAEPWGLWMGDGGCTIALTRDGDQPPCTRLVLDAQHLLCEQRPRSPLRVVINGATVADIDEVRTGVQRYEIAIPAAIASASGWHVELASRDGVAPRAIGMNDDDRTLTVGLVTMTIEGERS